jgi:thiol-disulfide isomerase/thioredoxin
VLHPVRALVAAVLACLVLAGCSGLSGTGDKGYITGDGQVAFLAPEDRGDPVELTGEDLDGEPLSLADLRGQVAVVNVWGAWCVQCRTEMPDLLEAVAETEGTASYVGINIRDSSQQTAKAFVRTYEMPYPSFYSPDGKALLPFSETAVARATPSTVVLDAEGRVAASIIGVLPSALTLVDLVEDVAAEQEGSDG